ncbi:MAG: ABC transporter substrate-binding protein [Bacillota bacterium]
MKKILILITLMALLLALVTGCGSKPTVTKDDFSESVELVWYDVGADPPKDIDMVMAKVNEYLKPKINAKLKLNFINYGDYDKKLNTMCSAGEEFDIAFTCAWQWDYRNGAARGYFADTTELFDTYGKDWKAIIYPELLQASTINGKLYAIAINKFFYYQQMYMFNKNMVDKYGIDISKIKTVDDLSPIFAKVHAADPQIKVFVDHTSGPNIWPTDLFDPIIGQGFPGAVRFDDKDCKVVNQYELPEFQAFLTTLHEFEKKGYMLSGVAKNGDFRKGDVFCSTSTQSANHDIGATATYGVPIVSAPAQQHAIVSTFSATGSMVAISATSKHPERAMALLNLVNTDPYLRNLLGYGIEGTHYEKVAGQPNIIRILPRGKSNYSVPNYTIGNTALLYKLEDEVGGEDSKLFMAKIKQSALTSPMLGFTFNSEPVKTEIAAIGNISEAMSSRIFTGEDDPKTAIPTYVAKCKAAGLDKVLAEMQKQLDAWKKTK